MTPQIKTIGILFAAILIFFAGWLAGRSYNAQESVRLQFPLPRQLEIGAREVITIQGPTGPRKVVAKIDTGAYSSSIDLRLAKSMGYDVSTSQKRKIVTSEGSDIRNVIDFTFILDDRTIVTEATVESRGNLSTKVLIGRKDLRDFKIIPGQEFLIQPESSAQPF